MPSEFTPWQRMKAFETQLRKIEDHWRIRVRKKNPQGTENENVIVTEPLECGDKSPLTYFNNGKCNDCRVMPCTAKQEYDYNFFFCDGYDQYRHREDRKHASRYLHIDLEEEYPCRTVPILTNSNYGHRPPIDPMRPIPKNHSTRTFYRSRGASHCLDANGYHNIRLNPTLSFKWNQQYGYTYSPPRN